jgi:hypothetical protein
MFDKYTSCTLASASMARHFKNGKLSKAGLIKVLTDHTKNPDFVFSANGRTQFGFDDAVNDKVRELHIRHNDNRDLVVIDVATVGKARQKSRDNATKNLEPMLATSSEIPADSLAPGLGGGHVSP